MQGLNLEKILISIGSSIFLIAIAILIRKYFEKILTALGIEKNYKNSKLYILSKRIIKTYIIPLFSAISILLLVNLLFFNTPYYSTLDKLSVTLLIIIITLITSNFTGSFIKHVLVKRNKNIKFSGILKDLVNAVIIVIGILIILSYWGINIMAILTGLGIVGLGVALALQETLSNFFAGLIINTVKDVEIGDYVYIVDNNLEGFIEDINWREIKIRELKGNLVIIPNSKFSQSAVINYSKPNTQMSVLLQLGVDYSNDLEKVESITKEVAKEVLIKLNEWTEDPLVLFKAFKEYYIELVVVVKIRDFKNRFLITHELIKAIKKAYEQEGIVIPFPITTVFFKDKK